MPQSLDSPVARRTRRELVAEWRAQAKCLTADPGRFFAEGLDENGARSPIKASKYARETINTYCVPCPVRKECLAEGLHERFGIWGGTTPKERRALRREAKNEPASNNTGIRILLIRS